MAPLHGGSSAGKSDLCCGRSLNVVGRPGLHQSGLMSTCFADCPSPGPRKNDLTIYWALGPFVRSFTLPVDPGISVPHKRLNRGEPLAFGTREQNHFRVTTQRQVRVFSSRDSARTEKRDDRCLRSPCRSRPCTGDRQIGFWGASTRLPKTSSSWGHDKGSWTRIWIIRAYGRV
jgi:hypothetical protein